jgi:endonuclease YncB( thermonuclease family)
MITFSSTRAHLALLTTLFAAACAATAHSDATSTHDVAVQAPAAPAAAPRARAKTPPTELFDIVKVVDGDTIHVQRNGKVEKLRLLSVDTEEQLSANSSQANSTKPPTVFGEECALWAREYFADLAKDGKPARVGLRFPGDVEQRDVYGRLLCDVILPDGTNYNLMLVEMGKSPYFDKYGWSETDHEAYVAAQKSAQSRKIGIWDPRTNMPKTAGVPAAKRPYDRLLPWWSARAAAIDAFRKASRKAGSNVFDVESAQALARAVEAGEPVECFGEVASVKDQPDGSVLVQFRAIDRKKALEVRVPAAALAQTWPFDLRTAAEEFNQNYVWLRARIEAGPKGNFIATTETPKAWRLAGPQPKLD